jgi:methyltransferase (TIGR00027 family)
MITGEPSRTALAAAAHRAAHQRLDGGMLFADPWAVPILGPDAEALIAERGARPESRGIRFFIVARSRLAEDRLAEAIDRRGVGQLVVLGAGLDTFAYRNPFRGRLSIFEVDHPATQAWKRQRLNEAGITIPSELTFAPIDFERDRLLDALVAAGFDPGRRTFFTWLGVSLYLTPETVLETLGTVAALPGGGEIVFDYMAQAQSERSRALFEALAQRVAAAGEPFRSQFIVADLHSAMRDIGFDEIADFDSHDLVLRYLGAEALAESGGRTQERGAGHVIHARATPNA